MGAVESALSAQAAGKHTGWSECILRPGEPGKTPDLGVPREVSVQPCDGGCGAEHPAASSGSASYCLRIALSSRIGWEERGGAGRGGEAAEESSARSDESPPPRLRSGQSQRCSAGSHCCSLSPYRLCCLQEQSGI